MSIAYQIKTWLLGPSSKFRPDDSVQLPGTDHLMVVHKIISKRKMKQPLIECQWYEPETKSVKLELFPENILKPFEWNRS